MKVIFTQNIENYKVGDIKEVADGYARNFLIPKNIAIVATPQEIENVKKRLVKLKKEEEEKIKDLKALAEKLQKISIDIKVEVGPKDKEGKQKLFGSITNAQIEEKLHEKGFKIDKREIEIGEQIKEPGEYKIKIKLGHGIETDVKIKVLPKK